ncbi:unnamed protein product (macronuclear) [Paramecium tetraurelia]|uniref:Uncharacterized protein n=1 Tax=Paramecium tetraurelia TaxID=5888 RepID=A0DJ70_PARTE|nr:uncharacterized protein GSPATT00017444001 [Paramecium tetraurelia]CAK83087.1 unnamed protein product [Paramecium tetraurelia]|eukprot:XP_001450484.1 hypothetical protein (macronuclear) [Paramecium tetraurelia strain d4-2]
MRTTPNSVKETASKTSTQDYKKQQSQPTVSIPESSQLFHIPQKYCHQRFKPQPTTSKSIEEKRCKVNKTNLSELNNRTNSSSKSRISGFTSNQLEDDSLYNSQNALKLKKIIGDSQVYNTNLFVSKSNLTCDSSSPGGRQNKSAYKKSADFDITQLNMLREKSLMQKKVQSSQAGQQKELIDSFLNLDKQIQGATLEQQKKQQYLKQRGLWDPFKDLFIKQFARTPVQFKSVFNQLQVQVREIEQQWSDVIMQIANNLFELFQNSAILMAYEQDLKLNEMIEQMRRERDIWQNNFKSLEQERDILLETVSQLKQTLEKERPSPFKQDSKQKDFDSADIPQLKEMINLMQQKISEMSEKESKLIKLVLAIRKSGIDIEKIYNEEVLNEDSLSEQNNQSNRERKSFITRIERSFHDADNSVVNDSDESSFQYNGRLDDESIIESIRRFENRNQNSAYATESKSSIKMKIDLSKCSQQQQKLQQLQQLQQQQQQKKIQQQLQQQNMNKLKIPDQEGIGFHQEFMLKFNEFSESWRVQVLKDEKRTKS